MSQQDRFFTPATPDEIKHAVSHAFRFDGRKQFKLSGKITASHLVHSLTRLASS